MLVVAKCAACQGTFQVEQSALGKRVGCPLCQAVVEAVAAPTAMPVAEVVGTTEAPLSLDDAEDISTKKTKSSPWKYALIGVLTLLSMTVVYVLFKYGSGEIPDRAWEVFAPEGGRCKVMIPGDPTLEDIPAGRGMVDGKKFIVTRWFEKVVIGFGWFDLAENADKFITIDGLANRHAEDLATKHNGKVLERGVVRYGGYDGREFVIETDKGQWIERIVMVPSKPRPRVYVMGIGGPKVTKNNVGVAKLFGSLRLEASE